MKIYLVGGAVRDKLLGIHPKDNDWVVVGGTQEEMIKQGFKPILTSEHAKDIPVFLHPETKEEHALARSEQRIGQGHTGFVFDISPTITITEDLKRRDLTINAIALPLEDGKLGELIDPFNGKTDLDKKILRHITPAFVEDPLRLIRTARFAACLGFQIAEETMTLMEQMVADKKLNELSMERIWKEFERALMGAYPENFFAALNKCGADSALYPFIKFPGFAIEALQRSADHKDPAPVRFAVLMHGLTKEEILKFCKQFNVPNPYRDLALLTNRYLLQFKQAPELDAEKLLDLLTNIGAFYSKERLNECLHLFELCIQEPSFVERIQQAYQAAKTINTKEFALHYTGHEISIRIKMARIAAIEKSINDKGFTVTCHNS
ncbi:CCA tRNA nucleotidyltransferase [Fluoribacter dumoffii]|uniref:Multifunctional CCA protein n=1 Tax=Fluoribacter dumoffii TaxID=463 RepID=A0A377GAZ5_9GAMM|nr:tRNA nucleotidyltransferase [Fluoribacter dumoffii]KTC88946.1 multifunctional tRNA nucleotidy [Fluoribacter dumoffii NY 23]MCW8385842.1 CCA tRNA nucleotidyltransferase [Fluoribacter dumoffii]MCW8495863.1 CCA tRNA nucleotidyltransferase [Fluoribacter dumoffii]STO21650.1 Multifunctional CCA protein [Fluoribacter dumoffii]